MNQQILIHGPPWGHAQWGPGGRQGQAGVVPPPRVCGLVGQTDGCKRGMRAAVTWEHAGVAAAQSGLFQDRLSRRSHLLPGSRRTGGSSHVRTTGKGDALERTGNAALESGPWCGGACRSVTADGRRCAGEFRSNQQNTRLPDRPLGRQLLLFSVREGDMLDLLKWRTHPDRITGCLSKLKDIDGSEIVKVHAAASPPSLPGKLRGQGASGGEGQALASGLISSSFTRQFLQDTLDTLFGILDENSQKYGSKVFDSLVS